MKIDVFFTIPQVKEELLQHRSVVVVDVLRSTTTICHAMAAGCARMIPAADLGQATAFIESLGRTNLLLGGEKNGRKPADFDLGNSPAEYTGEAVKGRTIVFLSSNGSLALTRMRQARRILIASFVNLLSVTRRILERGDDVVICCSGSQDEFCLEDSVCAGMIVQKLLDELSEERPELNDAARVGLVVAERYRDDLARCFRESVHGRFLSGMGFDEDLEACAQVDCLDVLPVFIEDQITLKPVEAVGPEGQ